MIKSVVAAIASLFLCVSPALAQVTYVGRSENTAGTANASVSISLPSGAAVGDTFVIGVAAWNSGPATTPTGLTNLGYAGDSSPDYVVYYSGVYTSGGPTSFTFTGVNYPKVILREYRGVGSVTAGGAGSTSQVSSQQLPALSGTGAYVGMWFNDIAGNSITCPSNLGNGNADNTQWPSCDGDDGSNPGTESAAASSNAYWIGADFLMTASSGGGTPTPTPTATPTATPTPSGNFIGRTQNNGTTGLPPATVAITTPSGIANGDMMIIGVASYDSTPGCPSGWQVLPVCYNSSPDYVGGCAHVWHTGDPTSYNVTNLNWGKVVMRVYSGYTSVEASGCAPVNGTNDNGSSFTIPGLANTLAADDEYVGFFFSDDATDVIDGPVQLSNGTANDTQWGSFDGDDLLGGIGSTPPSLEAAN